MMFLTLMDIRSILLRGEICCKSEAASNALISLIVFFGIYELKKFTRNKKTVTVKGYKKVSKKIKKLKGKKKYYVRVRTYKKVSGVKIFSPWSKTRTFKTR